MFPSFSHSKNSIYIFRGIYISFIIAILSRLPVFHFQILSKAGIHRILSKQIDSNQNGNLRAPPNFWCDTVQLQFKYNLIVVIVKIGQYNVRYFVFQT